MLKTHQYSYAASKIVSRLHVCSRLYPELETPKEGEKAGKGIEGCEFKENGLKDYVKKKELDNNGYIGKGIYRGGRMGRGKGRKW